MICYQEISLFFYGRNMNIAVLVSGGVDSSVALALLKEQGHQVTAFYLKIWLEDELSFLGTCPWQEDLFYVQKVCEQLKVPLQIISLQKEYWDQVVTYTIAQVKLGRTPNPDVLCNQRIKFGMFFDHIDASFDKVATGHYAAVHYQEGTAHLLCAPDPIKDQTYFLSYLSQEQLSRALFPIGHLTKDEVRALAHSYNLATKDRKDSQGICFLGKLKFSEFIKFHLGQLPGSIIEYETGKKIGEHKGFWFHTIGQRQGSGLAGGPWYVVSKDIAKNIVYMSREYYSCEKIRDSFTASHCNWITQKAPESGDYRVKLRHGKSFIPAHVTVLSNDKIQVKLSVSDQGIAPGQFCVLYQGQECLGSGIIDN